MTAAETAAEIVLETVLETLPGVAPEAADGGTAGSFLHDLAELVRAGDPYGRLDRFSDEHLLRPYVVDPRDRLPSGVACDVDPATVERLRTFYQAVAAGVERATAAVTGVLVDVGHEGFGRAAVVAGRLVLLADPLRDVQRFGFADTDALRAAGETRIARGLAALTRFPEVARADT